MLAFFTTLAGAGLVGAIDVVLGSLWGSSPPDPRQRLFLVFAGNAVVAALVGLWAARRRWSPETAFWAGALLACGPLLGQWIGGIWLGLPLGLLGVLLAPRLRLRGATPARALLPFAALPLLAPPLAWLALPAARDPLPKPPPPPLAESTAERPAAVSPDQPDVVLIVADTLRADALLEPDLDTPHLDRMRARGVWAAAGRAPCNQTLPSHLSLLTGLEIEKVGMRNNIHNWPTAQQLRERWNCVPVAERFRRAGYRTAAVASNPLLSMVDTRAGHQEFREGFETWDGYESAEPWRAVVLWMNDGSWIGYLTNIPGLRPLRNRTLREILDPNRLRVYRRSVREGERTLQGALHALDGLTGNPQPYFLLVHFMDPHSPYVAPAPFRGREHDSGQPPAGLGTGPEWEYDAIVELRQALRQGRYQEREQALAAWLHDLYREEVLYLDDLVGRVAERVDASGRPTLVLFTSDHGESFGAHLQVEHGGSLYEDELAIPFLLYGPGVPQDRALAGTPQLVDAARTLLELAGLDTAHTDGRNVLKDDLGRPTFSVMLGRIAVGDGRWKLHCTASYGESPEPGQYDFVPVELYDLESDPGELHNLLDQQPELRRSLEQFGRQRLEFDLLPHLPRRKIPERQQENLKDLGYVGGDEETPSPEQP
ncbi:MAG: hypothetical protein EYC70_08520 [Planctomycetota bacterium]|nr:MAG: hypothetical protein EYC70_08520 [Planctomycetota bacterium]